jgi:RNA polymerase sigma-70 factor (ECF subfamily)
MFTEAELISALRQGDPDAFSYLFEAYSDKIYRLAVKLLQNDDEAEGVVQDTFLRLFERLEQFEGNSKLGTWLYRVAYNASIDLLRKRRPVLPLRDEPDEGNDLPVPVIYVDWSAAPETILASDEAQLELEQAINQLPERYQPVFILRDIEGLSTAETAEILSISVSAVKVRLHRARLMLREHLSAYFGEHLADSEGVSK